MPAVPLSQLPLAFAGIARSDVTPLAAQEGDPMRRVWEVLLPHKSSTCLVSV